MISIRGVSKRFGEQTVLSGVSAEIEKGKITGIVGRNGSGKTVLLKCVVGLTRPDEGEIWVRGKRIGKDVDFAPDLRFIIEQPGFLPEMSGMRNLMCLAAITGRASKARIIETLETVELDPGSKKRVGKYSMGMRQRLGIAQALMEDPGILVFDEPMNGLDNDGVRKMRALFRALSGAGKTILLTSHNILDISILCDAVYQIDRGALSGPFADKDEILARFSQ